MAKTDVCSVTLLLQRRTRSDKPGCLDAAKVARDWEREEPRGIARFSVTTSRYFDMLVQDFLIYLCF